MPGVSFKQIGELKTNENPDNNDEVLLAIKQYFQLFASDSLILKLIYDDAFREFLK